MKCSPALGREQLGEAIRFFHQRNDQFDLAWTEHELERLDLSLNDFDP